MPLHPALVHVPLAAAVLLPTLALATLLWPKRVPVPWSFFPLCQLALSAALYGVMTTGEAEAELLRQVGFPSEPLEAHANLAQISLLGSLVLLFPAALAVRSGRTAILRRALFVLAQTALAASVVLAGRDGGRLVYEHDAPAHRLRALRENNVPNMRKPQ